MITTWARSGSSPRTSSILATCAASSHTMTLAPELPTTHAHSSGEFDGYTGTTIAPIVDAARSASGELDARVGEDAHAVADADVEADQPEGEVAHLLPQLGEGELDPLAITKEHRRLGVLVALGGSPRELGHRQVAGSGAHARDARSTAERARPDPVSRVRGATRVRDVGLAGRTYSTAGFGTAAADVPAVPWPAVPTCQPPPTPSPTRTGPAPPGQRSPTAISASSGSGCSRPTSGRGCRTSRSRRTSSTAPARPPWSGCSCSPSSVRCCCCRSPPGSSPIASRAVRTSS